MNIMPKLGTAAKFAEQSKKWTCRDLTEDERVHTPFRGPVGATHARQERSERLHPLYRMRLEPGFGWVRNCPGVIVLPHPNMSWGAHLTLTFPTPSLRPPPAVEAGGGSGTFCHPWVLKSTWARERAEARERDAEKPSSEDREGATGVATCRSRLHTPGMCSIGLSAFTYSLKDGNINHSCLQLQSIRIKAQGHSEFTALQTPQLHTHTWSHLRPKSKDESSVVTIGAERNWVPNKLM